MIIFYQKRLIQLNKTLNPPACDAVLLKSISIGVMRQFQNLFIGLKKYKQKMFWFFFINIFFIKKIKCQLILLEIIRVYWSLLDIDFMIYSHQVFNASNIFSSSSEIQKKFV